MALTNTHIGNENIENALKNTGSVYFIGIGGVSMSCLAEMSLERGLRVGGSDRTPSDLTHMLENKGITVYYGHRASQIEGYGAVVYTLAIDIENEEYQAAIKKGIPCISRADFLGYLMGGYRNRIGVSGMHGKSTTTAMLAAVFEAAKKRPTVVSGAALSHSEGCYRKGDSDHFIYEACEYMDSFLSFYPTIAVILNVELDHTDYFASLDAVCHSFALALKRLSPDGIAVLNGDDENVMRIAEMVKDKKQITFGLSESADVRATELSQKKGIFSFSLIYKEKNLGRISLGIEGRHHVYNALATAAAALASGVCFEELAEGISSFKGARRRMEYHASLDGVDIYEDYAHHPTEIRATLLTAKEMTKGDVWCVFQSHTYSRTAELFLDFADALSLADHALLLPIYAARETDTRGVSGKKLASALSCSADYVASFSDAADYIRQKAKSGDLVIIMGAGDVFHVLDELGIRSCS